MTSLRSRSLLVLLCALTLGACASSGTPVDGGSGSPGTGPSLGTTGGTGPDATGGTGPDATGGTGPGATGGTGPGAVPAVSVVASGLRAPWGVAFLPDGSALVAQRDDATVVRVTPSSGAGSAQVATVGRVNGVVPGGEGGLLGLAVPPGAAPSSVYAYVTAAADNRVLRLAWDGRRLGAATAVLTGIPKASIHDGGRLAFGPDGALYVATGDAGEPGRAQDPADLGGKILRITPEGRPAPGNPDPASPVWSLGHRNVQGLTFDDAGRLWAAEFGARDADELNLVRRGANYGWPACEGRCGRAGFVDPVVQWSPTSTASPSGVAYAAGALWVASLRGRVLYRVPVRGEVATGQPQRLLDADYGRLRTVAVAPDGALWVTTSNTDGRGSPTADDDRILRLAPS